MLPMHTLIVLRCSCKDHYPCCVMSLVLGDNIKVQRRTLTLGCDWGHGNHVLSIKLDTTSIPRAHYRRYGIGQWDSWSLRSWVPRSHLSCLAILSPHFLMYCCTHFSPHLADLVGWNHRLDGHEFEQAPGIGDGQESLACYSPCGHKELDTTEWLNWTESLIPLPLLFSQVKPEEN